MLEDPIGAFCAHGRTTLQTRPDGSLAGLTFGVKDLFDVAGIPTGAGSPAWLATHATPERHSCCVQRLLDAGAVMAGKTHTDEHAWSLSGQNAHYGTPVNVAAPGRTAGGSSSGSAAAVAAGLVDFALGSDTGGSVRLPASFCGIIGIRTSHGRIPLEGVVPLAPSYDTAGWFARDAPVFARVGEALLPGWSPAAATRLLLAADLFERAGAEVSAALADAVSRVEALLGPARRVQAVTVATDPPWRETFRLIQAAEAWAAHGEWVAATRPAFGPGVKERFAAAALLDAREVSAAQTRRAAISSAMRTLVPPGTLLLVPGAAGPAPRVGEEVELVRQRSLELLSPAGHAGLPQISLPLGTIEGCPIGLGVVAWPGGDEALLALAQHVMSDHG